MKLVVVESPTKAKAIKGFLGKDFNVLSSYGHVRDLPKSKLGVDPEHDFEQQYVTPVKARKVLTELKKALTKADELILATDEDREGEAISWHLCEALKVKPESAKRIVFHEITKEAILEAVQNPRHLDTNLVDAQRARRVLDRLVGYKLSPLLWKKIARGLSAGRVQSVTVRLIVDREKEREAFKAQEYWSIDGLFNTPRHDEVKTNLTQVAGKTLDKFEIATGAAADELKNKIQNATGWQVANLEEKDGLRHPLPPHMTATLQQDAARRLGWTGKNTMRVAQSLYEGVELPGRGHTGLITYMRTDSLNLAERAIAQAAQVITHNFGADYVETRHYKTNAKSAQEAHEAIRPTDFSLTPQSIQGALDARQLKLYRLIWERALASQMKAAKVKATIVQIKDADRQFTFEARGQVVTFPGFLKVYALAIKDELLPKLEPNETLTLKQILPEQHFTKPPARYSEATLIKALKDHAIGRPSTYAPTIDTIETRRYVEKDEEKRFYPTDLGKAVNTLLVENFPNIVDIEFTAHLEDDLDQIASGAKPWVPVIRAFYDPFAALLKEKEATIVKSDFASQPTDKICPLCAKPIVKKFGRFGQFYACTGFPDCKHTEAIVETTGVKCPQCATDGRSGEAQGEIVERRTRKGKIFYSCNKYPTCKFALWDKPTGAVCPTCGALMVAKNKSDDKCSNKECASNTK